MADEYTEATLDSEEYVARRNADGNLVYAKRDSEKVPAEDKREELLSASPADQRKLAAPPHTKPLTDAVEELVNTPTDDNNELVDLENHRGGSLTNDTIPGTPIAAVAQHDTPDIGKHLEVPVPVEHEDIPAANRRALDEGAVEAADLGPYPGFDTTEYNESIEARKEAAAERNELPKIEPAQPGKREITDEEGGNIPLIPQPQGGGSEVVNDAVHPQPWIKPAEQDEEAQALAEGRRSIDGGTVVDNTLATDRQTYEEVNSDTNGAGDTEPVSVNDDDGSEPSEPVSGQPDGGEGTSTDAQSEGPAEGGSTEDGAQGPGDGQEEVNDDGVSIPPTSDESTSEDDFGNSQQG